MTNRTYHHVAGGMRESHLSGQDLQSTMRLVKSWILQILNLMGFPSPSRNVVTVHVSLTFKIVKSNKQRYILIHSGIYAVKVYVTSYSQDLIFARLSF